MFVQSLAAILFLLVTAYLVEYDRQRVDIVFLVLRTDKETERQTQRHTVTQRDTKER